MTTVCIDVSAAVHQRAGLGRYAHELVKGLLDLSLADRVPAVGEPLKITAFYHQRGEAVLLPPIDQLPTLTTRLSVRPWRLTTALAHFTGLGQDRLFGDADIFHATEHLLPRLRRLRSVFTLHDLIFQFDPDSHKPLNIAFLKMLMPRFLRAAHAIVAVSECSKRDAVRLYNISPDKIRVIYEGVDPQFAPVTDAAMLSAVRAKYQLPERFIVHVGTIEPRKNLPLLFEVIAQSNQHLVVAGKLGWLTEPILAKVKELGLEDRVTFTGFVADQDLPALISAATLLAMPSKYEGFGLPVLEAMACGTPVIASNAASLPEVGGDAALYARPTDPASWAMLIYRVWDDAELQSSLREKGFKQAAKFKWQTMARETAEVYRAVCRTPN
jgi:glycosyltransferase involved in cell wall biosynthesis